MIIDELLSERAKTHGDFEEFANLSQEIKAVFRSSKNWPYLSAIERESLEMDAHKSARILSGAPHFADHWEDKAGYAKLVANLNRVSKA